MKNSKKKLVLAFAAVLSAFPAYAQSTLYTNSANGNVGIGTNVPTTGSALDLSYNTNSMLLPIGTTGQRPTGAAGMVRYNSSLPGVEAFYNSTWNLLSNGSGTVNSGTQYQLGYYANTGPAISGDSNIKTDSNNDLLVPNGSVGIGTNAPTTGAVLDLSYNSNSMLLPVGTTGQEPGSPVSGMIRYNSTTPGVEAYYSGGWNTLGVGIGTTILPNGTTATTQSVNDSSTKVATDAFANPASSIGVSGYVELPSGLIEEWGGGSTSTSGSVAVTFPLAFPNNVFQVLVSAPDVTTSTAFVTSSGPTTTGFNVSGWAVSGSRAATPYNYFAIGN